MHPETEPEFTLACPYCWGSAAPIEVTTAKPGAVPLVCSSCQKTWRVTNPRIPAPAVETK